MIITLSSVGGAPGVTSWSVLLAAGWPTEAGTERVVVEADLDGAVMGARFGVGVEPGASTLVSSARRAKGDQIDLHDIGRRVEERVWLVPGPESAEAARQLWGTPHASEGVASSAHADDRVWFVDAGRASPTGPLAPLFDRSSMSLVVCRSEHDALVQVPARVAALKRSKCTVGVLVVGSPSFSLSELQTFFGSHATWGAPSSDELVTASRDVWSQRRVKRSQLWRSAVSIATDLAEAIEFRSVDNDRQIDEAHDGR